jgi:hypothetical protein
MKTLLLLGILSLAFCSSSISQQCPPSALKIQSPMCDTPTNLKVNTVNCTTAKLNWKGNKEQAYIVNAAGIDANANTLFEFKEVKYSCNESGNCTATISVKEGALLNWNVQAICNINGAVIYSSVVNAKETTIPYCNAIASDTKMKNDNDAIKVYPNPTTGYLTVELSNKIEPNIDLMVFDVNGKKLYERPGSSIARSGNGFQLDLHLLSAGTYLLEVHNGQETDRAKFILIK